MGEIMADKSFWRFLTPRVTGAIIIAVAIITGARYIAINYPASPASENRQEKAGLSEKSASHAENMASRGKHATSNQPDAHKEIRETRSTWKRRPRGVEFVEALIAPLEYELKDRFWGWRPNDLIQFTDNVNEMQLGILEATRRATIVLTEKISRSGSAESLDPSLERAMNDLMVKPEEYWFPSAETKYREAIDELRNYQKRLKERNAKFYTRSDNLIPLLKTYMELLGSCDDNLVKLKEADGSPVSTFTADNYFYYAKGVAIAALSVLEAVEREFEKTIDIRNGADLLHHAIESCRISAELKPWLFVTEADRNGIFANHRANMAAHISHARYYLERLIEALST